MRTTEKGGAISKHGEGLELERREQKAKSMQIAGLEIELEELQMQEACWTRSHKDRRFLVLVVVLSPSALSSAIFGHLFSPMAGGSSPRCSHRGPRGSTIQLHWMLLFTHCDQTSGNTIRENVYFWYSEAVVGVYSAMSIKRPWYLDSPLPFTPWSHLEPPAHFCSSFLSTFPASDLGRASIQVTPAMCLYLAIFPLPFTSSLTR